MRYFIEFGVLTFLSEQQIPKVTHQILNYKVMFYRLHLG